jgi:hypothetical protein
MALTKKSTTDALDFNLTDGKLFFDAPWFILYLEDGTQWRLWAAVFRLEYRPPRQQT